MAQEQPITIKQPQNTIYDKMEFPGYEFREFPAAVPVVGGKVMPTPYDERGKSHPVVIVESQAELDALQGPEVTLVPVTEGSGHAMRVENEDDIRKVLYVQAEQAGVTIDKRWSVARIEDALQNAAKAKDKGGSEVV
jgi:hypothetical protein